MKSFIATFLLASAAIVGAQISALPPCGITCGLQAANATNCSPVTNFNCTCQYSNQAIILPILEACLAKSCTDAAQSSAAISAGEGICATISQTASSAMASASSFAKPSVYSTGSSAVPTTAKASSAATYASPSKTTVASYTGAAAALPTAGVEALVAAAGMVLLAL